MNVKKINEVPVMIWADVVEASAMAQIENLTTLPFLYPFCNRGKYADCACRTC